MTTTSPPVERVYPPKLLVALGNPILSRLLDSRLATRLDGLVKLHFTGRKSGKAYEVVVGLQDVDGRPAVLSNSPWRVNFRGGRELDVQIDGARRPARGELVEDPRQVAEIYAKLIEELGPKAGPRRLGIRANVDRAPTADELADLAEREGLAVLMLEYLG